MEKSIFMKKARRLSFVALLSQIVVYVINSYIRHHQVSILSEYGTDVYPIGDYYSYISAGTNLMLVVALVAFIGIAIMKKPHIIFAVIFAVLFGLFLGQNHIKIVIILHFFVQLSTMSLFVGAVAMRKPSHLFAPSMSSRRCTASPRT